jgi:hypothetical protein
MRIRMRIRIPNTVSYQRNVCINAEISLCKAGLWIRIDFNPDPAIMLNPDPAIMLNPDPDEKMVRIWDVGWENGPDLGLENGRLRDEKIVVSGIKLPGSATLGWTRVVDPDPESRIRIGNTA